MRPCPLALVPFTILFMIHPALPETEQDTVTPNRCEAIKSFADPALHRRWKIVSDLEHPGAPGRMIAVDEAETAETTTINCALAKDPTVSAVVRSSLVVLAGEHVRVVTSGAMSSVNVHAVALASAALGEPVRLRMSFFDAELTGVVRGPGLVELAVAPMHKARGAQ